jgi:hypothetical protein
MRFPVSQWSSKALAPNQTVLIVDQGPIRPSSQQVPRKFLTPRDIRVHPRPTKPFDNFDLFHKVHWFFILSSPYTVIGDKDNRRCGEARLFVDAGDIC